jgi:hypothetical protein
MTVPRYKHAMVLLKDGRALIIGGQSEGAFGPRLASTEIYDPVTRSFTRGPEMKYPRYKLLHGVATLDDGQVLQPLLGTAACFWWTAMAGIRWPER